MCNIAFKLFGAFSILVDDEPMTSLRLGKAKALLAYLASEPSQLYSRDVLMALLWPESSTSQARNNLRIALYRTREALNGIEAGLSDKLLNISRQTIQFQPQNDTEVDVLQFQERLRLAANHEHSSTDACPKCKDHLVEAAKLYQGEFLSGMALPDAPPFEEWMLGYREAMHRQILLALTNLANIYEQIEDLTAAHNCATKQLQLDPFQEEAHQRIMRILAKQGLVEEAVYHFDRMKELLAEELGAEPRAQTVDLLQQIRDGAMMEIRPPIPNHIPTTPNNETNVGLEDEVSKDEVYQPQGIGIETNAAAVGMAPSGSPSIKSKLDAIPIASACFGRQYEAERLRQWLGAEGCRLVSLLGIGGIGKSSLAASVVQVLRTQFDRVIWRSLRTSPRPDSFLPGLIQAMTDTQLSAISTSVDEQLHTLLSALSQQRHLLILDDFEHVLDKKVAGVYLSGYEGYGQLLELFSNWEHTSQLLLASRARPQTLPLLEAEMPTVRSLHLSGLDNAAGLELLEHLGLDGTKEEKEALLYGYSGNPLALKLAGEAIDDLYGGDLNAFQEEDVAWFGKYRSILAQQVDGLSEPEQVLLTQMNEFDRPLTIAEIKTEIASAWSQSQLIETIQNVQHRLLVERGGVDGTGLCLPTVWAEYLTRYPLSHEHKERQ